MSLVSSVFVLTTRLMFVLGRRCAALRPTVCGRVRHASESVAVRPSAKVNLPPVPRPVSMDRLVFVGTGSQQPIRERNTSGVGIRLSNGRSILIDAGEATQHAMLRRDLPVGPSNIDTICITHLHGDHVLGMDQSEGVAVVVPCCGTQRKRKWETHLTRGAHFPTQNTCS
jgi:hypothetical protein